MRKITFCFILLCLPLFAKAQILEIKKPVETYVPSSVDQELQKKIFSFDIRALKSPVSLTAISFRQEYDFEADHFQYFWVEIEGKKSQSVEMIDNSVNFRFEAPLLIEPGNYKKVHFYTKFSNTISQHIPTRFTLESLESDALFETLVNYQKEQTSKEKALFQKLLDYVVYQMNDKDIPVLSFVLMSEGKTLWTQHVFNTTYEVPLSLGHSHLYRWASLSKLFTTIMIQKLRYQGLVDLDVPITEYLPEYADSNIFQKITLRQILSHHSGLPREPSIGHYYDNRDISITDITQNLADDDFYFERPPTRGWEYSNASFAIAGRIIERVSGQDFETAIQENIFRPLAMSESSFFLKEESYNNMVKGYMWSYDQETPYRAPIFDLGVAPAINLSSSLEDIGKFLEENVSDSQAIMPARYWNALWRPQFRSEDFTYGLGYYLSQFSGQKKVGHIGQIYGYASRLWVVPLSDMGVAVNAGLEKANQPVDDVSDYALNLLWALKQGTPLPDWSQTDEIVLSDTHELEGTYRRKGKLLSIFQKEGRYYLDNTYKKVRLKQKKPFEYITDGRLDKGDTLVLQADGGVLYNGARYGKTNNRQQLVPPQYTQIIGRYGPVFAHIEIKWDGEDLIYFEDFYSYTMEETDNPDVFRIRNNELLTILRDNHGNVIGIEAANIPFEKKEKTSIHQD